MQRLTQTQRQTLKFSPLQIQMLNLLGLNTLELEQRIKDELEENPVLEEGVETPENTEDGVDNSDEFQTDSSDLPTDDFRDWDEFADDDIPEYKTRSDNFAADEDFYTSPMVQQNTWRDELKEQVSTIDLNERQRLIAEFIIDSLDDDGFLKYDAYNLADDISFTNNIWVEESEIEEIIPLIRALEPAGIAARDLQDCLLLQLERKPHTPENQLSLDVVRKHMHELAGRNYEKIMRVMDLDNEQLKEVLSIIAHLNPKPIVGGQNSSLQVNENILPEYFVTNDGGHFEVNLNGRDLPSIRLSKSVIEMAESRNKNDRATSQFVKSKLASARWFIDALKQREQTMLNTMRAIIEFQKDYFLTGDVRQLKPMILKDIADRIGMDISTISRVTSGKYAQTPFGIIHLKDLFTEGVKNDEGEEVSNREIQQAIVEIIEKEDKQSPYTDQQIQEVLAEKGYPVARRTVAKYREQMNIPIAKIRREL
ncbi:MULTISPECIES: RNA polymerase factor sigma-54 [unclassified Siphonobacter]|uniref:RNA polymerase factor sigma-54 n=1 Tax=unclassified Siphonobacter TaxID=2635712 RepID=UPI0027815BFE|nr:MULTISPECIES: RNA polymerase factor sigma-54 [unclassified Siphonobacter]MDQ1085856.1 RNA polymerase sigma-54 factor [Siphonobacter sp. SORGH_AS_1065]MDR6196127.1 RNA polymerase sigma-54 factor [Siphonobacter sp. SORGH_AS_0500]